MKRISLYTRNNDTGLRIVYPNGTVEYNHINKKGQWSYSCTSRSSKVEALKAIRLYDKINGYKKARFVCYL